MKILFLHPTKLLQVIFSLLISAFILHAAYFCAGIYYIYGIHMLMRFLAYTFCAKPCRARYIRFIFKAMSPLSFLCSTHNSNTGSAVFQLSGLRGMLHKRLGGYMIPLLPRLFCWKNQVETRFCTIIPKCPLEYNRLIIIYLRFRSLMDAIEKIHFTYSCLAKTEYFG
jgi:hypothetical protein